MSGLSSSSRAKRSSGCGGSSGGRIGSWRRSAPAAGRCAKSPTPASPDGACVTDTPYRSGTTGTAAMSGPLCRHALAVPTQSGPTGRTMTVSVATTGGAAERTSAATLGASRRARTESATAVRRRRRSTHMPRPSTAWHGRASTAQRPRPSTAAGRVLRSTTGPTRAGMLPHVLPSTARPRLAIAARRRRPSTASIPRPAVFVRRPQRQGM
jgi:hypothetical protein